MSPRTQKNSPYTPGAVTAICATKQILGKSELIVAHDATASQPKSDCKQKRPEKYGASMAANTALLLEQKCESASEMAIYFSHPRQPKIYDTGTLRIFGEN